MWSNPLNVSPFFLLRRPLFVRDRQASQPKCEQMAPNCSAAYRRTLVVSLADEAGELSCAWRTGFHKHAHNTELPWRTEAQCSLPAPLNVVNEKSVLSYSDPRQAETVTTSQRTFFI